MRTERSRASNLNEDSRKMTVWMMSVSFCCVLFVFECSNLLGKREESVTVHRQLFFFTVEFALGSRVAVSSKNTRSVDL